MTPGVLLQSAFAKHQSGQLEHAARLYEEVLRNDPSNADALNLLGVAHSQQKQHAQALERLMQAIGVKPDFVDAWINLAKTFSAMRRFGEALGACDVVLRLKSDHQEALSTQARTFRKMKDPKSALHCARRVLSHHPAAHDMARLEAECLVALRDFTAAQTCYEQCLAAQPGEPALLNDYAMLLVQMGDEEQAITLLESLASSPVPYLAACSNLGNLLYDRQQRERALRLHEMVVERSPGLYAGWINFANILQKESRLPEARQALERAIELQPLRAEGHVNLAGVLMGLGQEELAHQTLCKAIELAPDFADAWNNLGAMELDMVRPARAAKAYARAVELSPDLAAAQFGLALSLLIQGDFARGWPLYEWRWLGASQSKPKERPRFSCPQWTGQALRPGNDSIVVYHEQGFGDTIQFLRFVPALVLRFVKVVLVVQGPLQELVRQNLPPEVEVLNSEQGQERVRSQIFAWHCPMGSLPLALGLQKTSQIPGVSAYLRARAGGSALPALKALAEGPLRNKKKVGLCWAGNPGLAHDKTRSLKLAAFRQMIQDTDVCWVSLQRERSQEDADCLRGWGVLDLGPEMRDFGDTAAVISQLDLVISVDTVIVHLTGALGVPCWLLNRYQSEWRWMHGGADSVWYGSVRQWRQTRRDDWAPVLAQLEQGLARQFAATAPAP